MKQIFLLFAILIGMMTFVYWSNQNGNLIKVFQGVVPATPQNTETLVKVLTPNNGVVVAHEIKVEIVRTPEARAVGLSKYSSLEADRGMLFIFDKQDAVPEFWMKDMSFAIDIIWINDNKISEINSNVLPPAAGANDDNKLVRYFPKSPVDYVLEVKAGEVARREIKVGNEVILPQL